MRIRFWSILIVFNCCFSIVWSQENEYFTNHPVWKIQTDNSHEYPCMKYYMANVFLGDTLSIDSTIYYPVFERYEMDYDWQSPLPPYPFCNGSTEADSIFKGFIRSKDKRMYFRNALNGNDVLLFDFNLEIGDSIHGTALMPYDTLIVVAIDSFPVPGGYWKRFEVDGNNYTDYFLEGIGSSVGLYHSTMQPYNISTKLKCYSQMGEKYYPDQAVSNCVFYLELPEENLVQSIYPNPFNERVYIELKQHFEAEIVLYDMAGIEKHRESFAGKKLEIQTETLAVGTYFIEIRTEDHQIFRQKIIKL